MLQAERAKARDSIDRQLPSLRLRLPAQGSSACHLCLPRMGFVQREVWAVGQQTYRLYNCQRCAALVLICAACDCGQRYCAGDCAAICRQESVRRAGARYQRTSRGAHNHAIRQKRWRNSHSKVTHQSFQSNPCASTVLVSSIVLERTDARERSEATHSRQSTRGMCVEWVQRTQSLESEVCAQSPRCNFCHAPLPRLARLRSGWGRLLH
jgi:hypothetical protein